MTAKQKPEYIYLPDEANALFRFNPASHRYALRCSPVDKFRAAPGVTSITGMVWTGGKAAGIKGWVAKMTAECLDQGFSWRDNRVWYQPGLYLPKEERPAEIEFTPTTKADVWRDAKAYYKVKFKEAGDIGTLVHEWADIYWKWPQSALQILDCLCAYLIDNPDDLFDAWDNEQIHKITLPGWTIPTVINGIEALLHWVDQHHVVPLHSEHYIYDIDLWYCGILDLLARVDGEITLVDLKTSGQLSVEMLFQLGGYLRCAPVDVTRMGVLRLDKKTGLPEYTDCTALREQMVDGFEACHTIYRAIKGIEKEIGDGSEF